MCITLVGSFDFLKFLGVWFLCEVFLGRVDRFGVLFGYICEIFGLIPVFLAARKSFSVSALALLITV